MVDEVDNPLQASSQHEGWANIMDKKEKLLKQETAQCPRLLCSTFDGRSAEWKLFLQNKDKILSLYDKKYTKLVQPVKLKRQKY